ncbi:helix-turn-helix domain-containing protein [Streptomyces sp. NPDC048290]|uniref:AraC-like ligand-binding domain-containing protein n=1 Tax=Streptomyces sp. NPDC048290 TaxID=3155811 RepID=UPI0034314F5E
MLVTEFSTEIVPAAERFELFHDFTSRSHMPNRLRSTHQDDFRARMRMLHMADIQISAMNFAHLEVTRTPKLIRQSDPEAYQINYFARQTGLLSLAGTDTALREGDLVVMDTSRPYRGDVRAVGGGWPHMTVQFPRWLMPLPEKTVQRLYAVPISGREGMGAMLAQWLTALNTGARDFTRADVPTLASVTLDLLASVVAHCLEAEGVLSPETRRNALRAQIDTFVEQHLADPALTPRTIADAHHISLRHLQRLLAENGTSPAVWIRDRRLERCRTDLADPRLADRTVQATAERWGFTNAAHFSRLFRAAYGMSPRDYRNLPAGERADRSLGAGAHGTRVRGEAGAGCLGTSIPD